MNPSESAPAATKFTISGAFPLVADAVKELIEGSVFDVVKVCLPETPALPAASVDMTLKSYMVKPERPVMSAECMVLRVTFLVFLVTWWI